MTQSISINKSVPITNIVTDVENLLTELTNYIAIQLADENYPALTISGTPDTSQVDAATLGGQLPSYYDISLHNLNDLSDINITAIADNNILKWDNINSQWINTNLLTEILTIDGSGSGLDADLLDGHEGSYYTTSANITYDNTSSGLTAINVQAALDELDFTIDTLNDTLNNHINNTSNPHNVTAAQIGANNILTEIKTVDGAGSGLDADKVDGVDFNTSTTDPTGSTRLNAECYFYATRVYNAVYNDYAECFDNSGLNYEYVKNRIVEVDFTGAITLAQEYSRAVVGIVSDSYGYLLNGSEEEIKNGKKIPVGMAGTLWVDSENIVSEDNIYNFICSGKGGKARVIPAGEAYKYEGMIVGKIIGIDKIKNKYKIILCLK